MTKWHTMGVAAVLVALSGGVWWSITRDTPTEDTLPQPQTNSGPVTQSSSTDKTVQKAPITQPARSVPFVFSLAAGDSVQSWSFNGAYTGDPALVQKAQAQIANLKSKLGSGEYTDYQIYVSVANQYDLLGDGAGEFAALQKALAIDSESTGLAWSNLGNLLARLGAYASARIAYERAVAAQPVAQYQQALAQFNAAHPKVQ